MKQSRASLTDRAAGTHLDTIGLNARSFVQTNAIKKAPI